MDNTFKIIQVTTADTPRLSRFLSVQSGINSEIEWKNILEWMWVHNPSVKENTKLGWGLEDTAGNISGFIGNVPVQYVVSGTIQAGIWGTSWYVAEKAKDMSLKMYIHFTRQPEMIVSNTQTPRAEIVMKKLGFKEMSVQWFAGAYVFPLSVFSETFFRNSIAGLSVKKLGLALFGIATKIPQALLFLLYNRKNFAKEISLEKIDRFPGTTDQWFDEFKNTTDFTFARDQKTYEWLFCHPASRNDFLKYQVLYQNKLQGFLIFKARTIKGFHYIEIIDEALLPLPHKTRKQILLKTIFTLYRQAGTNHFLLLRSNMKNSTGFFSSLGGIKYNRGEKGYIKSSSAKPAANASIITSIDGDNLFF
jgi:hypothetical protein